MGNETETALGTSRVADLLRILQEVVLENDDVRDALQGFLGEPTGEILHRFLEQVQGLVEEYIKKAPVITDEQRESLLADIKSTFEQDLLLKDTNPKPLEDEIDEIVTDLQFGRFKFDRSELPEGLNIPRDKVEDEAWRAAQDAFRDFWCHLNPAKQALIERGFREEFQRLTGSMFRDEET